MDLGVSFFGGFAARADLQWSGFYRIEGLHIANSEMDRRAREKTYGMHHLVLSLRSWPPMV